MESNPKRASDGVSLDEWIGCLPNELPLDAIGLRQVIPTLRHSFGLRGGDLERAVERSIDALLSRGAVPVVADPSGNGAWIRDCTYTLDSAAIVKKVVQDWVRSGEDPDVGDPWFAILDDDRPKGRTRVEAC